MLTNVKILIILLFLVSCGGKVKQGPKECNAPMEELDGRPPMLIIGDSISIGYTKELKNLYPTKQVVHNDCNAKHSRNGIANIDRWVSYSPTWEVCTFNHGIWDMITYMNISNTEYIENLTYEINALRTSCDKILFVTTTEIPVNYNSEMGSETRQAELRTLAKDLMITENIPICDLFTLSQTLSNERRNSAEQNDVHYTETGYAILANKIKSCIDSL